MSVFEELINVLTGGALVLALITSYLVANKLWSRKHEKVVAESISVWAVELVVAAASRPLKS